MKDGIVRPVQSTIHVLATTFEATTAALRMAVPLARGAQARLVLMVTQLVPYAIALDRPVDRSDVTLQRYRDVIEELGGEARIRLCLCRRPEDIARLLPSHATVVVGGKAHAWWPTAENRFVRLLIRRGHHVVLVPMPVEPRVATPQSRASAVAMRVLCAVLVTASVTRAQEALATPASPAPIAWQYGGFVDVSGVFDNNSPSSHLFRNRGTTPRVDELDLNMIAAYVRKVPTESSRVGLELTVQTGQDAETFGFSATAPNIGGADVLRHLGPTDVSYLAPVGKGLTIQGGIFSSVIGYDSLYAKDNFNYTRPWGADYTPYLMLGANASYPVTPRLTATALVVNGYWHLANANNVPSTGGQLAYKATDAVTVKETVLYGPHQADTSLSHWRVLSDTIVERKTSQVTTAFEYQLGAERVADAGDAAALWMSAQLPIHWSPGGPWSMSARPEFCWDRDGRWTGFPQSVRALTTTLQYREARRGGQAIVRFEYRVDDSRGSGGGFFTDTGLAPTQQLVGVGLILTFDGERRQ